MELSLPRYKGVNDGIAPSICSLPYPSVHDAARLAFSIGPGALTAKIDLKNAYRAIPVHPEDRWLIQRCSTSDGNRYFQRGMAADISNANKACTHTLTDHVNTNHQHLTVVHAFLH